MFSIEYDGFMRCFVMVMEDERIIALGAETYDEAFDEAIHLIESGEIDTYV